MDQRARWQELIVNSANQGAPSAFATAALHGLPRQETIAALRRYPPFAQACRAAISDMVDFYEGNRVLNQVLNDRARTVFGMLAIHLHFSSGRDQQSGLTGAQMRALCAETGLCSPGRVSAMLLLMRFGGYLKTGPGGPDRRIRPLIPTEALLDLQRRRMSIHLRAMSLWTPDGDAGLANLHRAEFLAAMARNFVEALQSGFRLLEYAPDLAPLADRVAGLVVLFSVMLADAEGEAGCRALSVSALARRFAVSRAHVLALLRDAAAAGLVERRPDGRMAPLLRLSSAVEDFVAAAHLLLAHFVRSSLAEM